MTANTYPCWCWRNSPSGEDACGFCGFPKSHHHDNGYRSEPENGSRRDRPTVGGHPSSDRPASDLAPPPHGPGVGIREEPK